MTPKATKNHKCKQSRETAVITGKGKEKGGERKTTIRNNTANSSKQHTDHTHPPQFQQRHRGVCFEMLSQEGLSNCMLMIY